MVNQLRRFGTLGAAFLTLALAACSKDEELKAKAEPVEAGAGGTAANGECPSGLAGPPLTRIKSSNGSVYCMDQREVTWGEYKAFLAASPNTTAQPAECAWNTGFAAEYYEPSDGFPPPDKCPTSYANPVDGQAVNCVDFCDAIAYCESVGKHLCGRIGGPSKWGRVDEPFKQATSEQAEQVSQTAQSLEMEAQYACTNGGKTGFPYGNAYEEKRCIDKEWVNTGPASLVVTDPSSRQCHGTEAPFDTISDLSGSVREWNNLCVSGGCATIGGSFTDDSPDSFACASGIGFVGTQSKHPGVGVRCCAEPT